MAVSEVSICNMAFVRLGQGRITSLSQTGVLAEIASLYYNSTVAELLTMHHWPFSIITKELSESLESNYSEFEHVYTLPNDFLTAKEVLAKDYSKSVFPWKIEGKRLYTNESPCYLRYTFMPASPSGFTDIFIEALYLRLATKMCLKLTQDQSLLNLLFQEYNMAITNAAGTSSADSFGGGPETVLWSD